MTREENKQMLIEHLYKAWECGANTSIKSLLEQVADWCDEHPAAPTCNVLTCPNRNGEHIRTDNSQVIEKLQAEIERLENQWISVEDRLPEKINKFYSDFVFVAYHTKTGEYSFAIDRYDFEWEEFSCYVHAKYWMPIPEPPKGGKE